MAQDRATTEMARSPKAGRAASAPADQQAGAARRYRGRQQGGQLNVDVTVPTLPIMLTVQEASVALQLSEASVLKAIEADEILAYRLGRGFRIPSGGLFEKARREFTADLSLGRSPTCSDGSVSLVPMAPAPYARASE